MIYKVLPIALILSGSVWCSSNEEVLGFPDTGTQVGMANKIGGEKPNSLSNAASPEPRTNPFRKFVYIDTNCANGQPRNVLVELNPRKLVSQ
jgi:hypothetical protein